MNPKNCPKYLPADNPARIVRDEHLATMNAMGMSQVQIAKETGLSRPTVNRILNDDRAKAIIERVTDLSLVAHEAITRQKIGLCFNKDKNIAIKAIALHDKSLGIGQAHAPVHIQNMYVDQRKQVLMPGVRAALGGIIDGNDVDSIS